MTMRVWSPAFVLLFSLFLLMTCLTGCQTAKRHWPAREGVVLDAQTGAPIPDAVVIANWQGMVSYSNTRCFHQMRDITDSQGRYRFPAWENKGDTATSSYQSIYFRPHKYGYRLSEKTFKTQAYRENIYYLERDDSIAEKRLDYLSHYIHAIACGPHSGAKERLMPVIKSVYREASEISSEGGAAGQEYIRQIRSSISWYWRDTEVFFTQDQVDKYFNEHIKGQILP